MLKNHFKILFIIIIILLIPTNLFAKKKNKIVSQSEIEKIEIIDSLKQEIYNDTIKFDEKDIIAIPNWNNTERKYKWERNRNSYSKLYVVNSAYAYKLDLITSDLVAEFVNEFLDIDKIQNIEIKSKKESMAIWGTEAENGLVLITLNKKAKFNPTIAGIEKKNNKKRRVVANFIKKR